MGARRSGRERMRSAVCLAVASRAVRAWARAVAGDIAAPLDRVRRQARMRHGPYAALALRIRGSTLPLLAQDLPSYAAAVAEPGRGGSDAPERGARCR